jgi:alcohol dehydrogenase class IV
LEDAVAALRAFRPDWIVAIGGGSVLDGAKLCWARYEHPHFPTEKLDRPFALPPLRSLSRFVAVPTSAGTGSESSSTAVFTESGTGRKIPAVTHDFLPDIAILDPRLTVDLPPEWTAMTAFDALGHALEGYVSALENPLVDRLAPTGELRSTRKRLPLWGS